MESASVQRMFVFDTLQKLRSESLKTTSHKDERLVGCLETMQKALQRWLKSGTESLTKDVKLLCEGLCAILQTISLHYKLARKVAKLLVVLEAYHPIQVKASLHESCGCEKYPVEARKKLAMWSQLLEVSAVSRELITENFSGFMSQLTSHTIHTWSDGGQWSKDRQEELQLCVKVTLQLTQHLIVTMGQAVWLSSSPPPEPLSKLLNVLLCVLDTEEVYVDTQRLAATVFGYIVQLAPETEVRTHTFIRLLHCYEKGESFSLGTIPLQVCESSPQRSGRYGSLCLIQGFLSCCPVTQFTKGPLWDTDGQVEHTTLAMFLLTRICQLCDTSHYIYQSIKTLLLWYQKVAKCPRSLGDLHLTENHPAVSLTLPIIWNNLDSPVDGVSELGVAVFQAMIDLLVGKGGSQGDGKRSGANVVGGSNKKDRANKEGVASTEGKANSVGGTNKKDMANKEGGTNCDGRAENADTGLDDEDHSIEQGRDGSEAVCGSEGGSGSRPEGEGLVLHLMDKMMQMSWQVKAKHVLCAVLLPHVQVDKFLEYHSDTWKQLLDCMCTNYMAPPATQMYKVLCTAILKTSVDEWKSVCLPHLISGLTSKHSLMCYNVCHFWLPWTLSTIADGYKIILDDLKGGDTPGWASEQVLRVQVSVCMATRRMQIASLSDLPHKVVVKALLHPNDDIRLDAFAFVCNSPKTSECVSVAEADLLKCSLPYAMTSDSPPFRQQLQSHIRALVARVRDSVLAGLRDFDVRRKRTGEEKEDGAEDVKKSVMSQIDLVEWLWTLCTEHLHPGSNFQRLQTCLEWMFVILDTLVYVAGGSKRKKGRCPDSSQKVLKYAVAQGKWQFFTSDVTRALLTGVTDGTDDIRVQSCKILLDYFPHPLALIPVSSPPLPCCGPDVCGLLQAALSRCAQPRYHDADGGALLCKLLCHVCAIGSGCEFSRDKNGVLVSSHSEPPSTSKALAAFLNLLVRHLEESVKVSRKDLLKAARNMPSQGFIVAATYCVSDLILAEPKAIREVLQALINVTKDLVDSSLDILGVRLHTDGSAPSYEQMGVSIKEVIERSVESMCEEGEDGEVTLSTEHHLLLTWAWLNIRESSVLYSKLSSLPVDTSHSSGVLTVDQIQKLGQVMIKILTTCRHRGAIEGSSEGLCVYCTELLSSPHTELRDIPGQILEEVLSQVLEVTEVSAYSITRRSAGLPLIVKAVLIGENKHKQVVLLKKAVTQLVSTAKSPLPSQTDQRLDLPQVHALNILQVLFAESSLALTMMLYMEEACVLSVEGFGAPLWSVRNSAMRLFSTLLNRMLGQKKTKEDTLHTTTTSEFFSHFPTLQPFLLSHLQRAAQQHTLTDILPCLFPVLSILCKLSPGVGIKDSDSTMSGYLEAILTLLGSPVYAVRERSAQAVVSLISPQTADQFLLELALDLPVCSTRGGSVNLIHGQLMCLSVVLRSLDSHRQQEGNVMSHLQQVLEERDWLGGSSNDCPLVRGAYLTLMVQVNPLLALDTVASEMLDTEDCNKQVGFPQLTQVVFQQWLSDDRQSSLRDKVSLCLDSCVNVDIKTTCVKFVNKTAEQGKFSKEEALAFQKLLLQKVSTLAPWPLLCECLETLVTLYDAANDTCVTDLDLKRSWEKQLLVLILDRGDSRPAALAVGVLSMFVDTEDTCSASVTDWTYILQRGSDPGKSEEMRLNTARSLHITALPLIYSVLEEDFINTTQDNVIMRILQTTVALLVDENSGVRRTTAAFVKELPGIPRCCLYGDIHPSYALRLLFEYALCELCQSPVAMRDVMSWMSPSTLTGEVLEAEIQGKEVVFESQDLNPYRENTVILFQISGFLQSHKETVPQSCFNTWRNDLVEQLQLCSQCLVQHCTGVLNMSGKPRVCDAVSGLLHRVQVFLSITGDHKDFTDPLLKLSQLMHLHPALHRLISTMMSGLNR